MQRHCKTWPKLPMAKTNYTFEKRQKELAKQKKQAEKLQKKAAAKDEQPQEDQTLPTVDETSSPQ